MKRARVVGIMVALKKLSGGRGVHFTPTEKMLLQWIGYQDLQNRSTIKLKQELIDHLRKNTDIIKKAEWYKLSGSPMLKIQWVDNRLALVLHPVDGIIQLMVGDDCYEPTAEYVGTLPVFRLIETILVADMGLIRAGNPDETDSIGISLLPNWAPGWLFRHMNTFARSTIGNKVYDVENVTSHIYEPVQVNCIDDTDPESPPFDVDQPDGSIMVFKEMQIKRVYRDQLLPLEADCVDAAFIDGDVASDYQEVASNLFYTLDRGHFSLVDREFGRSWNERCNFDREKNIVSLKIKNPFNDSILTIIKEFGVAKGVIETNEPLADDRSNLISFDKLGFCNRVLLQWLRRVMDTKPSAETIFNPYYKDNMLSVTSNPYVIIDILRTYIKDSSEKDPSGFPANVIKTICERMTLMGFPTRYNTQREELIIRVLGGTKKSANGHPIHISINLGDGDIDIQDRLSITLGQYGIDEPSFLSPYMLTYMKAYEALCYSFDFDELWIYEEEYLETNAFLRTLEWMCYGRRSLMEEQLKVFEALANHNRDNDSSISFHLNSEGGIDMEISNMELDEDQYPSRLNAELESAYGRYIAQQEASFKHMLSCMDRDLQLLIRELSAFWFESIRGPRENNRVTENYENITMIADYGKGYISASDGHDSYLIYGVAECLGTIAVYRKLFWGDDVVEIDPSANLTFLMMIQQFFNERNLRMDETKND